MIILKTEAGQQAFKARSPLLSARQRSVFILFDGVKSSAQVLAATSGLGVTAQDIDHLVAQAFLAPMYSPADAPASASLTPAAANTVRTPQQRYREAMPIATQLSASLGLRGYLLTLAIESASGFDDLLALLPKIQNAVGSQSCAGLERLLKG